MWSETTLHSESNMTRASSSAWITFHQLSPESHGHMQGCFACCVCTVWLMMHVLLITQNHVTSVYSIMVDISMGQGIQCFFKEVALDSQRLLQTFQSKNCWCRVQEFYNTSQYVCLYLIVVGFVGTGVALDCQRLLQTFRSRTVGVNFKRHTLIPVSMPVCIYWCTESCGNWCCLFQK